MTDEALVRQPEGKYGGSYNPSTGGSFTKKPSTRIKLHEIGHKVLGHRTEELTLGEFVDQELAAEAYSYRQMDRPVTSRIAWPVTYELVTDFGLLPLQSVAVVERGLGRMGVTLTGGERRALHSIALGGRR